MTVADEEVQEWEDNYKRVLFWEVRQIDLKQCERISQIHDLGQDRDLESNLPNVGITFNNKLIELQNKFKKVGLSMYAKRYEGTNFVGPSLIGGAIISDLTCYASKAMQNMDAFFKEMTAVTEKKLEKVQGLEKASHARRFFVAIRNLFIPVKEEYIFYTQAEMAAINVHLLDYIDTDNQLWEYNLRDAIPSLAGTIKEQGYKAYEVSRVLAKWIIPDLKKLDLADLIPQLQQALIAEYKKDLPDSAICTVNQEDMYLYVPDFTGDTQDSGEECFEQSGGQCNQSINNPQTTLGGQGVVLRDYASIYKTVNASDRQSAARAIDTESHQVLSKMGDTSQGVIDLFLN